MSITFAIIKPDAVAAGNAGNILALIEKSGFKVRAMRRQHLTKPIAEGFYAVHRERPTEEDAGVAAALNKAWGQDIDGRGYYRRKEGKVGNVLGSYYWHDDQVRVRSYVTTTDQGVRLLTEWQPWPIPSARALAKPGQRGGVVAGKK